MAFKDNENIAAGSTAAIDFSDAKNVTAYGVRAQRELADFSAILLDQLRSIKTGDIEEPLEALMAQVQSVSLSGFSADDKNTQRFMRKAKKVLSGYNRADKRIFELEMRLDAIKGDLTRDIVLLDKLKEKYQTHRLALETYITAGEKVLAAVKPSEGLEAGSARDVLEKRIHDLKLAHTIAMQTEPQINLIQNTNRALIERIQTSLLSTIPLWRNQMVLASTLIKQKTIMNMEKALSEVANEKLKNNAQALKEAITNGENPMSAVQRAGEQLVATIQAVKSAYVSGETDIESAMKAVNELADRIGKQ